MEPQTEIAPALNLLLLAPDTVWRSAVLELAGRMTPIAIARSSDDAMQQLWRVADPFTHVLIQSSAAGSRLPEIASAVAQTGNSVLILLGDETASSFKVAALRAPLPADLLRIIAAETNDAQPLVLSPADILLAFDAGQVDCQFQPIVRLSDGVPVGLEALARLQHPVHGTLTPDWFIPQIETAGLSMQLTEAVVRSAMNGIDGTFLKRQSMFLTINLPLDVLLFDDALPLVDSYRVAAGIPIEHILIELTESRPVFDVPLLAAALRRWRGAGYHLAIDDMGPEMVNQADLFDLPFDVVKLDKTIVLRSRDNMLAYRYLQRTVANAQARSLSIIAEGIEDGPLWIGMRDLGVDYAQGFLIARAMPAAALDGWLKGWEKRVGAATQP